MKTNTLQDSSLSAEHAREIEVQQGEGIYQAYLKLRNERDDLLVINATLSRPQKEDF